jgi:hypothetical protein
VGLEPDSNGAAALAGSEAVAEIPESHGTALSSFGARTAAEDATFLGQLDVSQLARKRRFC